MIELEWGVQQLTGGKVASSWLSLSKRELVVLRLQTIFALLHTTSSTVAKTGSKLCPITQLYHLLALALPG